jgi:protein ImuB
MPICENTDRTPLWLAIQCPHLALDLTTRSRETSIEKTAVAVSDGGQRRPRVLDCNPAALRAGIRPGLAVSAALGLVDTLQLTPRDPRAERDALERLAAWCYQYSSHVCPLPGRDALLLEAGGSQRLFGPANELATRLEQDLQRLGYHARIGSAPTPEAAQLAAAHGLHLAPGLNIGRQISKLPLDSLLLEPGQLAALQKMGFRSIGEVLRLPRKALGRRLGPSMVDYLDRLTGARPDPRKAWQPPEGFSCGMDLVAGTTSSQALLFPLRRLVAELCGVMRARDRGTQALDFELRHEQGCESLRLGLQQPTRDEERIMLLLRERLEQLQLTGPVHHVQLVAGRLLPFDAQPDSLFQDHASSGTESIAPLLERLQARLGEHAIRGLKGVQDHRPEHSWAMRELHESADCTAMPYRPVWLFARPQRCRIGDYHLLAGPERIETGWWDGHDCRRDYFVVRDATGRMLWAFHEYKPSPGWYLQGLFA